MNGQKHLNARKIIHVKSFGGKNYRKSRSNWSVAPPDGWSYILNLLVAVTENNRQRANGAGYNVIFAFFSDRCPLNLPKIVSNMAK